MLHCHNVIEIVDNALSARLTRQGVEA